ncbi:hypothetical protein CHS0354_008998 [Potamilus streckersoni]|uniref:Uncharacterized protein n=1 Tax=Potamilus streckersoni TaxID=2493646 RepID=A0AAE0WEF0_9BIVA|nr:hypothetical protein CHS0354_008998 [Potamilus streckersoni]
MNIQLIASSLFYRIFSTYCHFHVSSFFDLLHKNEYHYFVITILSSLVSLVTHKDLFHRDSDIQCYIRCHSIHCSNLDSVPVPCDCLEPDLVRLFLPFSNWCKRMVHQ